MAIKLLLLSGCGRGGIAKSILLKRWNSYGIWSNVVLKASGDFPYRGKSNEFPRTVRYAVAFKDRL